MVRPYGRSRFRSTAGLTRLQHLRHLQALRERLNRSVERKLPLPNSTTEQRQEPAERLAFPAPTNTAATQTSDTNAKYSPLTQFVSPKAFNVPQICVRLNDYVLIPYSGSEADDADVDTSSEDVYSIRGRSSASIHSIDYDAYAKGLLNYDRRNIYISAKIMKQKKDSDTSTTPSGCCDSPREISLTTSPSKSPTPSMSKDRILESISVPERVIDHDPISRPRDQTRPAQRTFRLNSLDSVYPRFHRSIRMRALTPPVSHSSDRSSRTGSESGFSSWTTYSSSISETTEPNSASTSIEGRCFESGRRCPFATSDSTSTSTSYVGMPRTHKLIGPSGEGNTNKESELAPINISIPSWVGQNWKVSMKAEKVSGAEECGKKKPCELCAAKDEEICRLNERLDNALRMAISAITLKPSSDA
ncbi:hypothetical protein WR25_08590 [Diploscapter pachys]|uniref:Uncharacterized protein n=1 Tax=Diploscapter pachys TaxID=2018661 RepID=A0A2A2JLI7_9BILA|nr:hypothetical protein WR25_08590 [Diploscapter pachys]